MTTNCFNSFRLATQITKFLSGVLLGLSVLLFASSPGHGGTAEWLSAHNEYRCMHDVPPVTWSENLAKVAEDTANNCACTHCNPHGNSENIYCSIATEQVVVDNWYSEVNNYDYNNPIWYGQTGHFINVVAKALTEVGCTCTSGDCVCVYGGYFDSTTPSGLNQNVLKPIRTKEACKDAQYVNGMWVEPGKNADLVPTPGVAIAGPPGFCKTDAQGRLLVNVTNRGSVPAPTSVTVVTFAPGGSVEIPTPSVAVGSSVTLPVQIPAACFNPDCDFTITVDSKGTVSEGNETNNTANGSCLG